MTGDPQRDAISLAEQLQRRVLHQQKLVPARPGSRMEANYAAERAAAARLVALAKGAHARAEAA